MASVIIRVIHRVTNVAPPRGENKNLFQSIYLESAGNGRARAEQTVRSFNYSRIIAKLLSTRVIVEAFQTFVCNQRFFNRQFRTPLVSRISSTNEFRTETAARLTK